MYWRHYLNEALFLNKIKTEFENQGIIYKKINDQSTKGMPDSFVCLNSQTLFLEAKYLDVSNGIVDMSKKSISKHFGKVQLMTMTELEVNAKAKYVIGTTESRLVSLISPDVIKRAWRSEGCFKLDFPMEIPRFVTFCRTMFLRGGKDEENNAIAAYVSNPRVFKEDPNE